MDDEFYVTGRATVVNDVGLRNAALAACHFTPGDDHVLVDFGMESALWGHYSSPPSWPPVYSRWEAELRGLDPRGGDRGI